MGLWVLHETNEAEPTLGLGEGPPAAWLSMAGSREPKMHPWGENETAPSSRGDGSISLRHTDVPPHPQAGGHGCWDVPHLAFPAVFGSYVWFIYLLLAMLFFLNYLF